VTGPENYTAAERLLAAADEYETEGDHQAATHRRTEALVRAALALTASHALHHHPLSTSWAHAINPQESQP
jgi:hypothetical protein